MVSNLITINHKSRHFCQNYIYGTDFVFVLTGMEANRPKWEEAMTSKQRAYLKGLAMTMEPIAHIGKASLTPEVTNGIREAIDARELIKIAVLKNCTDDPRELAVLIAERTGAQVVQVIGKRIVLYKPGKEYVNGKKVKRIELPGAKK